MSGVCWCEFSFVESGVISTAKSNKSQKYCGVF
jgi:hypothetical protein